MGAVNTPGVIQITTTRTLTGVLSMAGGLRQDAGPVIRVTRPITPGAVPLPGANTHIDGQVWVTKIAVRDLLDAKDPKSDIELKSHDVVTVPRAEMLYVVGEVNKPGGYVMNEHETMSVLQALSLAGGYLHTASPRHSKILRLDARENRVEVDLALDRILEGKAPDVPLNAGDVVFVPSSVPKKAAIRALEAAIQTGTGIAVWH